MTYKKVKEILHHENRYLAEYSTNSGDTYRLWFIGTAENIVYLIHFYSVKKFLKIIDNFDQVVCTAYNGTLTLFIDGELLQEITLIRESIQAGLKPLKFCEVVTEADYANYCRNERKQK